jgi:hypothetical protein
VPVKVDVTARVTVAFVFPTPAICVPVQVTVSPLRVQTGWPKPCAKWAPWGALLKLTTACAVEVVKKNASRADVSTKSSRFMVRAFRMSLVTALPGLGTRRKCIARGRPEEPACGVDDIESALATYVWTRGKVHEV